MMTPEQVRTLGWLLVIFFGVPIVVIVSIAVLEWRTLSDGITDNHITATLRAAFKRQPGAVFLGILVWALFLTAVFWGIAGHVFFQ